VPPRTSSGGSGFGISGLSQGGGGVNERQPVKAKRKRIFRIGGKKSIDSSTAPSIIMNTPLYGDSTLSDPHFSFPDQGAGGMGFGSGPGSGTTDRMHYLRQRQFVSSEFDAEDMDRYFRSNDDLPTVPPPPSVGDGGGSPPRLSTMQAIQQHLQQQAQQGLNGGLTSSVSAPGSLAGGGRGGGDAMKRQVSSNPSRLR
jgi:distribution and morphology protein 34